jgi:phage terminase small subunit
MGKLTNKQRRFVDEYLVDLNATRAAMRAGYSTKTSHVIGHENINKPEIAAAICKAQEKRAGKVEVTAERVLREYAVLAFSDMAHYLRFAEDGQAFLDWENMPKEATRAISEITQEEYVEGGEDGRLVRKTKFRLHNKGSALDSVAKHLGMFIERHEITGKDGLGLNLIIQRQGDGAADAHATPKAG